MSLVRSASAINCKKETLFNPSDNIPILVPGYLRGHPEFSKFTRVVINWVLLYTVYIHILFLTLMDWSTERKHSSVERFFYLLSKKKNEIHFFIPNKRERHTKEYFFCVGRNTSLYKITRNELINFRYCIKLFINIFNEQI